MIKQLLRQAFAAAIEAARPEQVLPPALAGLAPLPGGREIVLGLGKAGADMARVAEQCLDRPLQGLVVVPDGHEADTEQIEVITAAHPVPDERSVLAARRLLAEAARLEEGDRVILLVSGGGSALCCLPAGPLDLAGKQALSHQLLQSGAPIQEMNLVRRHLSGFKGGRLALAAAPASLCGFAISDVPGDDIAAIASGPASGVEDTPGAALAVLDRYGIEVSADLRAWLLDPRAAPPGTGHPGLARADMQLVATPLRSLQAAAALLQKAGWQTEILGDDFQDSAAQLARSMRKQIADAAPGTALISGGECSVQVTGSGSGGRNAEFVHEMVMHRVPGVWVAAGDSDGIDGAAPIAGALAGPDSFDRAVALGCDPAGLLANNDSHSFFGLLGDQIITGPTRTNVNDIRIVLKAGPENS